MIGKPDVVRSLTAAVSRRRAWEYTRREEKGDGSAGEWHPGTAWSLYAWIGAETLLLALSRCSRVALEERSFAL